MICCIWLTKLITFLVLKLGQLPIGIGLCIPSEMFDEWIINPFLGELQCVNDIFFYNNMYNWVLLFFLYIMWHPCINWKDLCSNPTFVSTWLIVDLRSYQKIYKKKKRINTWRYIWTHMYGTKSTSATDLITPLVILFL